MPASVVPEGSAPAAAASPATGGGALGSGAGRARLVVLKLAAGAAFLMLLAFAGSAWHRGGQSAVAGASFLRRGADDGQAKQYGRMLQSVGARTTRTKSAAAPAAPVPAATPHPTSRRHRGQVDATSVAAAPARLAERAEPVSVANPDRDRDDALSIDLQMEYLPPPLCSDRATYPNCTRHLAFPYPHPKVLCKSLCTFIAPLYSRAPSRPPIPVKPILCVAPKTPCRLMVVAAGMPRSGSTLQYELLRHALSSLQAALAKRPDPALRFRIEVGDAL